MNILSTNPPKTPLGFWRSAYSVVGGLATNWSVSITLGTLLAIAGLLLHMAQGGTPDTLSEKIYETDIYCWLAVLLGLPASALSGATTAFLSKRGTTTAILRNTTLMAVACVGLSFLRVAYNPTLPQAPLEIILTILPLVLELPCALAGAQLFLRRQNRQTPKIAKNPQ